MFRKPVTRLDLQLICNNNSESHHLQFSHPMERVEQILSQMLRVETEKGNIESTSPLRKELLSTLPRVSNFENLTRAQITQIVKVCKDYLDHALEFRR